MNETQYPSILKLQVQENAEKEKKAEGHFKAIGLAVNAMQRNGVGLFAQIVIAGSHMEELALILPHGQLEKRLAEKCPTLAESSQKRWRQMFRDFTESVKAKRPTVGLFNTKGRLKTDKKTQNLLLEIIPEIMEGRNARDFMADCRLMRQIEDKGGFKYKQEDLVKWLKENHPEWLSESEEADYEAMPSTMKRAFAKWLAGQAMKSAPEQKPADEAEEIKQFLLMAITSKYAKAYAPETLRALEGLRVKLGDKWKALLKADAQNEEAAS